MTCIVGLVAKDKVWMGGDSCASDPAEKVIRKDPKVFINGEFLLGYAGSYRFGQLLRFKFTPPGQKEGQDDFEYLVTDWVDALRTVCKDAGLTKIEDNEETRPDCSALIGFKGKLYVLDSDLQVGEPSSNYYSIGIGAGIALGALFAIKASSSMVAKKQIQLSLEAAATYAVGVEAPFVILSL